MCKCDHENGKKCSMRGALAVCICSCHHGGEVVMQKENFGGLLRSLRTEAGLSIDNLSVYSGISATSISQYEHGKVVPAVDKFFMLCKTLGAEPGEFLGCFSCNR